MIDTARIAQLERERVITQREAHIIRLRYVNELSQRTVALALGVSRSTIRDAERSAHAKIARHERTNA